MQLCIGIIADSLNRPVLYKNYANTDNPFVLERSEIFNKRRIFNTGVLYLAQASSLPEAFSVQDDAALICIGMPPKAYAKSSLHLLVLDDRTDLIDLSNDVTRIFFEYHALEQKLQDSVNKGRSIQYMVELMAPYFNNELMVVNDAFYMIGQSNKTIHLNEISGIAQPDSGGILAPEAVTFFKNDIIFSRVRNLTEPFFYESSIFVCRALCMNVFHRGEYACRVIVAEDLNTFRGYEAGMLRFFTTFIQLIYDLSSDGSDILPRGHMAELFLDLLNGEALEIWRLENSFSQNGWQLSGSYLCACIMPSDRDYYNRTIQYYCQIFNRDINGCCFFEFDGLIVCVVSLEHYGMSIERFIAERLETFRDGNFRIGYSNKLTDIENLRHYYKQAHIALQTGQIQNPSRWHNKFSDIVLYYLESKMTQELDGRYLCAPEIITLYEYDKKNRSGFLQTLRVYLDNQMNAVKTAADLYIHRSTMVYRLERIKELTGIDFKNPDKVLYLKLSTKLFLREKP